MPCRRFNRQSDHTCVRLVLSTLHFGMLKKRDEFWGHYLWVLWLKQSWKPIGENLKLNSETRLTLSGAWILYSNTMPAVFCTLDHEMYMSGWLIHHSNHSLTYNFVGGFLKLWKEYCIPRTGEIRKQKQVYSHHPVNGTNQFLRRNSLLFTSDFLYSLIIHSVAQAYEFLELSNHLKVYDCLKYV